MANQNNKGRPKTTIKFESDFDFEQANTKFEEMRLNLAKLKVGEEVKPEQVWFKSLHLLYCIAFLIKFEFNKMTVSDQRHVFMTNVLVFTEWKTKYKILRMHIASLRSTNTFTMFFFSPSEVVMFLPLI